MKKLKLLLSVGVLSASLMTSNTPAKAEIMLYGAPPQAVPRPVDPIDLEDALDTKVDIAVTNATVADVVRALNAAGKPFYATLEDREVGKGKVTFAARGILVKNVLRATASLLDAELYVLGNRFLICPPAALEPEEMNNLPNGTMEDHALLNAVVHALQRSEVVAGDRKAVAMLDEHTQRVLQRLLDIRQSDKPEKMFVKNGATVKWSPSNDNALTLEIFFDTQPQRKAFVWGNVRPVQ